MIFVYLYRMPNDVSTSLGVPIISDLIQTIDAIRSKQKIVATYQLCIDTLFKFSDTKEATVILADGTPLTINERNKLSNYTILKKNKNAINKIKTITNEEIDNIKDYAIKDSIMNTKAYFDSKYIDNKKEDLTNDAIDTLSKLHSKNTIRTELDIINKIISDNNLGSIESIKYTIDKDTKECTNNKDINNFCKLLSNIILPNNKLQSIIEIDWNNSKTLNYEILLSSNSKLIRNNNGEYEIE